MDYMPDEAIFAILNFALYTPLVYVAVCCFYALTGDE